MGILKTFSAKRETAETDALRLAYDKAMANKGRAYIIAWTADRQRIAVHECPDTETGTMLAKGMMRQGRYVDCAYAARSQSDIAFGV
jgi:hypothetical protein